MLPAASSIPAPDSFAIRIATPADAAALADWLHAHWPLPQLAARGRRAALERLLARPELGACVIAETAGGPRACLPALLSPHLGLHGLVAQASEWWEDGTPASGAYFDACLAALAEWCAAHGVRHLLLAPGLPVAPARRRRHASGLWHIGVEPGAKLLG
ncbi:hypothetical protein [Cupriavidus respiraculi]|uniref:hypothetical protein n=1 Tax=Cupriavidus respiraculi TaxID=195930 RepID=UPI001F3BEBF9|nr:hypothetical protein [Cupriavidus respiraculi]